MRAVSGYLRFFSLGMLCSAAGYFLRHEPPVLGFVAAVAALLCFLRAAWLAPIPGSRTRRRTAVPRA
jgi:hypothetical protein